MSIKIVTANHLVGGQVVFLSVNREWTGDITIALLANSEDDVAALEQAGLLAEKHNIVVGPYLIDVSQEENGDIVPVRLRERLRLAGPSIRTDLGYQGGNWHPAI